MTKPDYIEFLEVTNQKFFSRLVSFESILMEKIDDKKFTLMWIDSDYDMGKFNMLDRVYKTQHPFYIYVTINKLNKKEGQVCIYYESHQLNEVIFFFKPFINSIKK